MGPPAGWCKDYVLEQDRQQADGTAFALAGKGYSRFETAIHPGVFQWLKH
jgi:hypothetical protein